MIQKRATSVAFFILTTLALGHAGIGLAQEAVYRCGTEYTNDAVRAKQEKCKLLEGGAVVTVPAHKRTMEVAKPANQTLTLSKTKTAEQEVLQRQRDSDSRAIIESELKKTESQLIDLRKQYAGLSSQQDLDRKLALKQQMARVEADVASLKRELKR
jgi:uncharacterized protein (UPF0179 family)